MKILVLSDSHSALRFMRMSIDAVKPDAIIHLGDYVCDADALHEEYPGIPFYQVAGNCDRYRVTPDYPEIRFETISGVRIFLTHGHLQGVKQYVDKLILDAQRCNSDIILYGHTHCADCRKLEDGSWLLNPGSCGYSGGSVGLIEIHSSKDFACKILYQKDLEALV